MTVTQSPSAKYPRIASFAIVCTLLCLIASVVSLAASRWWLADILANLRIQWIVAFTVLLIISLWLRRRMLVVTAVTGLALNGYLLPANAFRAPGVVDSAFRVVSFNVLTSNTRHDEIVGQILDADAEVVAVLELSHALQEYLMANSDFAEQYSHSLVQPQDGGNFGIGLFSTEPFETAKLTSFNDERILSIDAVISIDAHPVRIIATHTLPPIGRRGFEHRNRHLQMLGDRVETSTTESVVVIGDLNITPWSPICQQFCERSGLLRVGGGMTPTWYRFPAFPFGLCLDYVLATPDIECRRFDVADDVGSDHRLVFADLGFVQ